MFNDYQILKDYCWTEGMLERYDVSELKNNLQNKNFFQPRLTAEFRVNIFEFLFYKSIC